MSDGYKFTASCPRCGAAVEHIDTERRKTTRATTVRTALCQCTECAGTFRILVVMWPAAEERVFDVAPLADTLGVDYDPAQHDPGPLRLLAMRLGSALNVGEGPMRQRVYRAARIGLTATEADEWATALGQHPGVVWPQWWDAMVGDDELVDADA